MAFEDAHLLLIDGEAYPFILLPILKELRNINTHDWLELVSRNSAVMRLSVRAGKKTMVYITELKDDGGILSREKKNTESKQITKRKDK